MANPIEIWKSEKHGLDVWPDIERYATHKTPPKQIDAADLERMKWHGFFYRKRDGEGRYMNRIRITGCELSSAQAKQIAYLAYQLGHGIIDITTRANIQIQGLAIEHLPEVTRRLERVGLTSKQTGHDNIRNVFGHPFSGVMADEIIDTNPLAHAIDELFIGCREFSDLPRKLNICLNGSPHHSAHFWTQDISFLAMRNEAGEPMFQVLLGGTQGQNPHLAWHLPVLVAPEQVVEVTRAIIELYRARGSREKRNSARFRYLMEEIGVAGVLAWLDERLLYPLVTHSQPPGVASSYDELIGWFPQRDANLWTMGLSIPLGRLSWQQLEGLAVLANKWGDGQLRTTHEQGLAVINIPTAHKSAAATDAAALGLSLHADELDNQTIACTGSQFCTIAVVETKGRMFQLISQLRARGLKLHGIRIHMSGCPSSCAQHFTADIGLKGVRVRRMLGTREGFDVFLGGGITGTVQMALPYRTGVDTDQLPTLIEEVVTQYYRNHTPGQTFSSYWREELGNTEVAKAGDEEYRVPTWVCECCEHRHEGEDPPMFCPRCAALRRYFARLDTLDTPAVGANC
jgi:ferredoxin-nitrite reductase